MPHSLFTSRVSRSWPFWRALIYWLVGGRGFGLFLWLVGIPSWKSWELSCVDRSLWVFFVLMLFIFYVFGRGRSSLRRGLVSSCEERGCCLVVGRGALSAVDCGAVPLAERRLREPGSWARARPRHLWLQAQWDRGMASGSQRRSLCCLDVAPGLWDSTVRGFLRLAVHSQCPQICPQPQPQVRWTGSSVPAFSDWQWRKPVCRWPGLSLNVLQVLLNLLTRSAKTDGAWCPLTSHAGCCWLSTCTRLCSPWCEGMWLSGC